jgi:hypothetical protein
VGTVPTLKRRVSGVSILWLKTGLPQFAQNTRFFFSLEK